MKIIIISLVYLGYIVSFRGSISNSLSANLPSPGIFKSNVNATVEVFVILIICLYSNE